jgi:RHS repeat-associated protein
LFLLESPIKSAVTIDGASFTLDNAGNRTAKTDQRTAVATSYGYDNIYQLLSANPNSGTAESYAYDPVGNRLSSAGVPSYSYNSSNELTSNSSATYGYDLNGNAVTKNDSTGITTYAWDFENRMTSVTLPGSGGSVTFAYDPFGRRIKKVSSSGTSIFAYDGDNLVEETNASGVAVARYSQGLNIDEPLAMLRGGATNFYNADGLGSITSLSNATGSLAQTYTFDSFGMQLASSGLLTNPFQYTGRESDPETGLYYYRARYYDSNNGRFTNEDPTAFEGGINFYVYVDNDPQDFTDPYGLKKYKCDLLGNCIHLPSGHVLPPIPDTAGNILVKQQFDAYRNCVLDGIKNIKDPTPIPRDIVRDMVKATANTMKPKYMPGDPGGPMALPKPTPNPLGPDDGLAVATDLMCRYNARKREKVADACSDRFPLARLSREF